MRALLNLLSRRKTAVSIGLLLLITLVWVVGRWLAALPVTTALLITLGILLLWIVLLLAQQKAAERGANELEQSIKAQNENHVMALRPEKRQEVELLRNQLTAAIQSLKKSRLGKGRAGKAALYALPWYMIVGPPAAGKTTAIRNSGLEFPFGADREIQGVGGTRNCDWWFTSSAIFLDTAGRYMTEGEDQEEWLAFLDVLRKNRRRQPINGVLVAVSIADLLNAAPEEIDGHARNIRKRVDELIQRLGVRFPVYLVFTKCDLLNGFVEFFEDLSRVQRQQVWGCTFSEGQLRMDRIREAFEREFMALYETLLQMRLDRFGPGMKRENRRLVFAFPLQLLAAKDSLSRFVGKVFQPNPYQESPLFRGFYLTSGTQEGVPIDRVLQSIASGFGLPPEVTEQFSPEIKPKAYFIQDLFTHVVIPDEQLVRLTSRAERGKRNARRGTFMAAAAVLALFVLAVTRGYLVSRADLKETGRKALLLAGYSDSARAVQAADLLFAQMRKLNDPPRFTFGMDRTSALLPPLRALFYKEMAPFVRRNVLAVLEDRLRDRNSQRLNLYEDLKSYLLLTSDLGRLRDQEENQKLVTARMMSLLEPNTAGPLKEGLRFFASDVVAAVEENLTAPFPANRTVIESARAVAGIPSEANVYSWLKGRMTGLQDFAVSDRMFQTTYALPGLFTRTGADSMAKLIETELKGPDAEAEWVLDLRGRQTVTPESERARMKAAIEAAYFREYAAEWWKFLAALRVKPFADLASAAEWMKRLGDGKESPLLLLFQETLRQTRFQPALPQVAGELPASVAGQTVPQHRVDMQFAGFHRFVEGVPAEKLPGGLTLVLADVSKVGDALEVLRDTDPKNTRSYAARMMRGDSSELTEALRDCRQMLKASDASTREVLTHVIELPLLDAWRVILGTTEDYLNQTWRTSVFEAYRQLLQGMYPFDPQSARDASLGDVAEFFSGTGKLNGFVETELRPFLADGEDWQPRQWEGTGIRISPAAREGLRAGGFLSRAFIKGNEVRLGVEVGIERPTASADAPDFDRVCLTVGGQEVCLHCKKDRSVSQNIEWPGPQRGQGASIRIINERLLLGEALVDSVTAEGDWGLFRLLSRAEEKHEGASRAEYRYHWLFDAGIVVPCLIKAETSTYNPFARSLAFKLPDRLN